jgi:hypothetical protein
MTELEETEYGYRVALADSADTGDAASLLQEVRRRLRGRTGGEFGVLLDLRRTSALPAEAQEVLALSLGHLRRGGMTRQAVVVNSRIILLQARHLAREAGADEICRYFDSASQEDWERMAVDWLARSLEPSRTAPEPGEE